MASAYRKALNNLLNTVSVEEGVHASALEGGELGHAGVVGVVHEVMDRVNTGVGGTSAGVPSSGAAGGGSGLGGGVGDGITAGASALEGVVETEPMAGLVGQGAAEVEVGRGSSVDGGAEDGAAVLDDGRGRRLRHGEVAVSEDAAIRGAGPHQPRLDQLQAGQTCDDGRRRD